jgi:hypothetical protein
MAPPLSAGFDVLNRYHLFETNRNAGKQPHPSLET